MREICLPDDDGIGKRVRTVGANGIDVDTSREQRPSHVDVAVAGGDHQQRESLAG